jgi:hypothetical protein
MEIPIHLEVFRHPLEGSQLAYQYTWVENALVQMQWNYTIEWLPDSGPKIWIWSYYCWQRRDPDAPFEEVEHLPFDVPMSDWILQRLVDHARNQLYLHSVVVGPMKAVPLNFLDRAWEAAKKGYDMKLLREASQREASEEAGRPSPATSIGVGEAPASSGPAPPENGRPSAPPPPKGSGGAPDPSIAPKAVQGKATTIIFPNSTPEEVEEHRRFQARMEQLARAHAERRQASGSQSDPAPPTTPPVK